MQAVVNLVFCKGLSENQGRVAGGERQLGTLRSMTATSTKMSPQNKTLLYYKSFAIIPSRSRPTIWAKYPKNKLVRAISE